MTVNENPEHRLIIKDKVAQYVVERAPPQEMRLQRISQLNELYQKISEGEKI